jgi:hypothetical protein
MRVWGRVTDEFGNTTWVEVSTSPTGDNSLVYLTWLAQVLKLNLRESPFYASWGIPAEQSVIQQIAPDFYVTLTQQRFTKYFTSLALSKYQATGQNGAPAPGYNIRVIFKSGASVSYGVPGAFGSAFGPSFNVASNEVPT